MVQYTSCFTGLLVPKMMKYTVYTRGSKVWDVTQSIQDFAPIKGMTMFLSSA